MADVNANLKTKTSDGFNKINLSSIASQISYTNAIMTGVSTTKGALDFLVGKLSKSYTATLSASATTVVTIEGVTASTNYVVSWASTATNEQIDMFQASNFITTPTTNTLTFTAMGITPTATIPVTIIVLG